MILEVLKDPLMLKETRQYISEQGRGHQSASIRLSLISGAIDGLALVSVMPMATALTTGQSQLGISLSGWFIIVAVLAIIDIGLRYTGTQHTYAATFDLTRSTHQGIGNALSTLPLGWFRADRSGELSQLVTIGFMNVGQAMAHLVNIIYIHAATLVVLMVGSWLWDPRLGLTLTLTAPIVMVVMVFSQSLRRKFGDAVIPSEQELAHRIVEFATCQPALRAAGRSDSFKPLEDAVAKNDRAMVKELWLSLIPLVMNGIVVQFFVVVILTIISYAAIDGSMTPVQTIVFMGLTLRFTQNLNEIGQLFVGIVLARPALKAMGEILGAKPLPEPTTPAEGDHSSRVELEHVTFGYDPDSPVLNDVSFTAEPGQVTAIVGPSGSGKTTIARLISRFWDTQQGSVKVDGVDIRELGTEALMHKLSMVFQDVYLFDDTLEANIRIGRPDATTEEVHQAGELAGVGSIARHLPNGWDTPVGEGGRSLSGGERQRVSVARALLKNAPIVLFDEATSALDAENERNILAAMEQLRTSSTLIIIAHKLDTVRTADKIIVLDEFGHVTEEGTHDELFEANGSYRNFWDRRTAATGWSLVERQ